MVLSLSKEERSSKINLPTKYLKDHIEKIDIPIPDIIPDYEHCVALH
jgi:hypothetical protein